MTTDTLNLTINRQTIVDQMAAFLYAIKAVGEETEITNIQFGDLFGVSKTEHVPIKISIKEKRCEQLARNYKKEAAWEDSPAQVKRRVARNKARRLMAKKGLVHKGDGKELDHVGYHRKGSLDNVPTRVVSRHANRVRQPPRH